MSCRMLLQVAASLVACSGWFEGPPSRGPNPTCALPACARIPWPAQLQPPAHRLVSLLQAATRPTFTAGRAACDNIKAMLPPSQPPPSPAPPTPSPPSPAPPVALPPPTPSGSGAQPPPPRPPSVPPAAAASLPYTLVRGLFPDFPNHQTAKVVERGTLPASRLGTGIFCQPALPLTVAQQCLSNKVRDGAAINVLHAAMPLTTAPCSLLAVNRCSHHCTCASCCCAACSRFLPALLALCSIGPSFLSALLASCASRLPMRSATSSCCSPPLELLGSP